MYCFGDEQEIQKIKIIDYNPKVFINSKIIKSLLLICEITDFGFYHSFYMCLDHLFWSSSSRILLESFLKSSLFVTMSKYYMVKLMLIRFSSIAWCMSLK